MTLKRKIRSVLDYSAKMTGLLAWCEHRMRRGVTVLMYHRVLPDEQSRDYPLRSLVMPESAFQQQVRWLSEHCEVLPLTEALGAIQDRDPGEAPLVAITFDDGYADNAEIAAPILERFEARGTFFIATGFVASGDLMWFDRASVALDELPLDTSRRILADCEANPGSIPEWMAFLKRQSPTERDALVDALEEAADLSARRSGFLPMSVPQARALHDAGHEIGSHTVSHGLLPQLSDDVLMSELKSSRATLENWIGTSIRGIAYPNGDVDERVASFARRAGYEYACTTQLGMHLAHHDPFLIQRFDITRDRVFSSAGQYDNVVFRSEVSRFHDFLRAG